MYITKKGLILFGAAAVMAAYGAVKLVAFASDDNKDMDDPRCVLLRRVLQFTSTKTNFAANSF